MSDDLSRPINGDKWKCQECREKTCSICHKMEDPVDFEDDSGDCICEACYNDLEQEKEDNINCIWCGELTGTKNSVWSNTCCICGDTTLCDICIGISSESNCHLPCCSDDSKNNEWPHKICLKCEVNNPELKKMTEEAEQDLS